MMARRRRRTRTPSLDPNVAMVNSLISEAARGHTQRVRQAEGASVGLRQSLAQRTQDVGRGYDEAERIGREASARASAALGGLSPAADPYKAITTSEQASGLRRAAESRARAGEEIGRIGTSIEREKSSRIFQSGEQYQETLRQIAGEAGKVAAEEAKGIATRRLERVKAKRARQNIRLQGRVNERAAQRAHERKLQQEGAKPKSKSGGGSSGSGKGKGSGKKGAGSTDFGRAFSIARELAGREKFRSRKSVGEGRRIRRRAKDVLVSKYGVNSSVALQAVHRVAFGKRKPFKGR
jgi:hypothetical protein